MPGAQSIPPKYVPLIVRPSREHGLTTVAAEATLRRAAGGPNGEVGTDLRNAAVAGRRFR